MQARNYFVYILANRTDSVYVGITNDLWRLVAEYRAGVADGFTKTYRIDRLVCFETFTDVNRAIAREKQLKGRRRDKKEALIATANPRRQDLFLAHVAACEEAARLASPYAVGPMTDGI
ncbi:MAG: GIY-YIG nuclease family protein [Phycisphaerae bacterium]